MRKVVKLFYKGIILYSCYVMVGLGTFVSVVYDMFCIFSDSCTFSFETVLVCYVYSFLIAFLVYFFLILVYLLNKQLFDTVHQLKIKDKDNIFYAIVPDIREIVYNLII